MHYSEDYWRGIIRRTRRGDAIYIHALKQTADFYGWSVPFDAQRREVQPPVLPDQPTYVKAVPRTGRIGGRRLTICRSPVKQGSPKGMTNVFRVARSASLRDIAQVALYTVPDFQWMTDPQGRRLDRAAWLRLAF